MTYHEVHSNPNDIERKENLFEVLKKREMEAKRVGNNENTRERACQKGVAPRRMKRRGLNIQVLYWKDFLIEKYRDQEEER